MGRNGDSVHTPQTTRNVTELQTDKTVMVHEPALESVSEIETETDSVCEPIVRPTTCCKFWTVAQWRERESADRMLGSDFDKQDGFIHMCTIDQCQTIATRYFG